MEKKTIIILLKQKFSFFSNKRFVREWTKVLTTDAKVFNGLFAGIQRIANGEAKNPSKIIREWCIRTKYRWEGQAIVQLCERTLMPLVENGTQKGFQKWTRLLLEAAYAAGIITEANKEIILDEANVNAYIEWDGKELYVGDTVEVMNSAWYQDGQVLEQGHCKFISSGG